MTRPIIEVDNVSKRYRLGQFNARTLREEAEQWFSRRNGKVNGDAREFWALKNVSFNVHPGEVLGIIGRNGAGKSTLLKILSRITEPTSGEIRIRGRVASLLEVGTGFHPELTGRENIYLNGAILGMTRTEIAAKFDEIVDFSGIERFLDTPVKRYSSGMYVRLAFAVAAHLEPEILIVDEVLAVGDAEFQRKCLGKMREVSGKEGRTVLFVSHNMAAVQSLSQQAILLVAGQNSEKGSAKPVVEKYLAGSRTADSKPLAERSDRLGSGQLRFTSARFLNAAGEPITKVMSGGKVIIEAGYQSVGSFDATRMIIAVSLWDEFGEPAALFATDEMGTRLNQFSERGYVRVEIPELLLRGGLYSLKLQASYFTTHPEDFLDMVEDASNLRVVAGDYWGSGYTNRSGNFCIIDADIVNS